MGIAERVREIRSEAGLTQDRFAQRLGKTTGTIGNWERGETTPDPGTVLLIADVFRVSVDWLRHGAGPMHIDPTSRDHAGGKAPTAGSVKAPLAGEGSSGYDVRTITLTTEDDVNLLPAWAVPILMAASAIIVQSADVERAKRATEKGKNYRLRLLFEDEETDPHSKEQPEPPQ